MTGVGLEPTTNGLTYLIGFHRPTGTPVVTLSDFWATFRALKVWTIPSPSQACRV